MPLFNPAGIVEIFKLPWPNSTGLTSYFGQLLKRIKVENNTRFLFSAKKFGMFLNSMKRFNDQINPVPEYDIYNSFSYAYNIFQNNSSYVNLRMTQGLPFSIDMKIVYSDSVSTFYANDERKIVFIVLKKGEANEF